jgi:serine/threonine protein kinase/tetratricopeptide (TPR) repeat protein
MTDTRHHQLRRIFDAAVLLPPADRAAFVATECAGDAGLQQRVEDLLAACDDGPFLATPHLAALPLAPAPAGEAAGSQIGPYTLRRTLGEGGFGTVWLADQKDPVTRQVALKILKPGMDTEQVVARFEQERQALARLDHPHVARVIDAGATAAGRPFFVMEFVDGLPLVDFCDRHQLPVDARIQLLAQVCDAVQHAHGRGIIHRDLKPSNVLVTAVDGRPLAKVIDFGIAKAIAEKLTDRTLFTEARQLVGTLQYMSPEQAAGSPDLDIRTDVWSLGVVLYELLAGTPPFVPADTNDLWQNDLQRQIREDDPPRPSTRLLHSRERAASLASQRRTTVHRLPAAVRGELDWIVMRAIEKERTRRYQTAHELAADLRRYLAGEPVLAAPPSRSYRLRKFVRRNRAAVAAAAGVLLALVGGAAAFAWQADVARGERDRAVTAETQGKQVLDLMLGALNSADPFEGGEAGMLVTEAMVRAAARLDDGQVDEQPEVEFELRHTIANILTNHGAAAAALPHAERAAQLAAGLAPGDDPRRARAGNTLAQALHQLGRTAEAAQVRSDALAMLRRLYHGDHETLVPMLHQQATVLVDLGRPTEAALLVQESLAMAERLFPGDHWYVASLRNSIGHEYFDANQPQLAEPEFEAALAMARRLCPGDHPKTARYLANLGLARADRDVGAAAELLEEALAMTIRLHPGDHPDVVRRQLQFAGVQRDRGAVAVAFSHAEQALAMARRLFAGAHPQTAAALDLIGTLHKLQNDPQRAERHFAEALAMVAELHPGDHPQRVEVTIHLADARLALGRSDGVTAMLEEALAMSRRLHAGDHGLVVMALRALGYHHWAARRGSAAQEQFAAALAMQQRLSPGDQRTTIDLLDDLGSAELLAGDFAAAEATFAAALTSNARFAPDDLLLPVRLQMKIADTRLARELPDEADAALAEAFAAVRRAVPPQLDAVLRSLRGQGLWYLNSSRPPLAERVFTELVAACQRRWPAGHRDTVQAHDDLGLAQARQRKFTTAEATFAAGLELLANLPTPAPDLQLRLLPKRAEMHREHGRFADALAGYQAALALADTVHPGDHAITVQLQRALGLTHFAANQPALAEPAFAAALAMQQRLVPGDHRTTVNLLDDLGSAQLANGQPTAAATSFTAALAMLSRLPTPDPAKQARLESELARTRPQ